MRTLTRTVHPAHYAGEIEPIDLIVSLGHGEAYCVSNVIKYVSRYDRKGEGLKDLLKAKQYLEWLIELQNPEEEA